MSAPPHPARNGIDVPTLSATAASVRREPATGHYGFRVTNRWVSGAHSRATVDGFRAAGRPQRHAATTTLDADHPTTLVGTDRGPTPLEYVGVGLAASLTTAAATVAAMREVDLFQLRSTVDVDLDVGPLLGVVAAAPPLPTAVRVTVEIEGDATDDQLRDLVAEATGRAPVAVLVEAAVPLEMTVCVL